MVNENIVHALFKHELVFNISRIFNRYYLLHYIYYIVSVFTIPTKKISKKYYARKYCVHCPKDLIAVMALAFFLLHLHQIMGPNKIKRNNLDGAYTNKKYALN